MTVKFTTDKKDLKLIFAIAERAIAMAAARGEKVDAQCITMDLSATHARTPLRLEELAGANDFNFAHDVFGISHNINRETGALENHFSPRYTSRFAA